MPADRERLASLSLDLDNQWSYMMIHGDAGWQSHPSYLDLVCPRVLEMLDRLGLKITFFVVGQDAALPKNRAALASLARAGHEIGNHSFKHEPWLHLFTEAEILEELTAAADAIEAATGQRPVGFRGPGFSLSPNVLTCLSRLGYRYDASTFPTFLGPIARFYYMLGSKLSAEERKTRGQLYGKLSEGMRPLKPYHWDLGGGSRLLEVPVTTMPLTRAPFHLSYLIYLLGYSRSLAMAYLKTSLAACDAANVEPSLLLHPLDFIGGDEVNCLGFFPGMKLKAKDKVALAEDVLAEFARRYRVLDMRGYAAAVEARGGLPLRKPDPLEAGAAPPPTARPHSRGSAGSGAKAA